MTLNQLTVSRYLLSPPPVFPEDDLADERQSQVDPLGRLASLAASAARGRAALKEQSDQFEELFREAERNEATPEELEGAANIILENERKAAATLVPQIEKLERNLARRHPPTDYARSVRRAVQEALDIGRTWLELYQNLRIRLLKLASDCRAAAGETGSPILSDANEMERYLRKITDG
jgi:hypothetical protein